MSYLKQSDIWKAAMLTTILPMPTRVRHMEAKSGTAGGIQRVGGGGNSELVVNVYKYSIMQDY